MKSVLDPLRYFYEEMRLPVPAIGRVQPSDLPEPERSLLVHDYDMTPTLEAAHGGKLKLRVLRRATTATWVDRLVALVMEGSEEAVGIGAIRIFMDRLPLEARDRVLEFRQPFGTILLETGVAHSSRPDAYFHVMPDRMIMDVVGMREAQLLHGRRNTIRNASGEEIAKVVEILAPPKSVHNRRVS